MKIGIIDVDLVSREKHRFPNLACEKISGYWKKKHAEVVLIVGPFEIKEFKRVYVSKVFTDTPIPDWLSPFMNHKKIVFGGTGFYFDKAPNLPDEIEHHMPDYDLYNDWIESEKEKAKSIMKDLFNEQLFMQQFKEYTDYSIGFLTRGCFRKCKFCVNQKYNHVFKHSPLSEFYDKNRKKICLLDDNFLGFSGWKSLLNELIETGKPFKFKQGLDERLLTKEKCNMLFSSKYDGDFTFAFDNIADYKLIKSKLELIRQYAKKSASIKFYILVGFESTDAKDIENAFKRIDLLLKYKCLPYVMRYQDRSYKPWKESKYKGLYIAIARWANQPSFVKKKSFRQYCEANQERVKTPGYICATMKAMMDFEAEYPKIAAKYFDQKFGGMQAG